MELLIKKEELKNLENSQAILFEKSCLGENRKVWPNLIRGLIWIKHLNTS